MDVMMKQSTTIRTWDAHFFQTDAQVASHKHAQDIATPARYQRTRTAEDRILHPGNVWMIVGD